MSIKKYLGYNERKCRIIQNFLAGVVISHKIMNGLLKFAIVTSFKGPSLTYEYRYAVCVLIYTDREHTTQ